MAFFGKDERLQRPDDVIAPPPSTAVRPSSPAPHDESVQTHLGKGCRVEGKLTFEGSVRIDGHVEGEIEVQDTLVVGDTGVLVAQINSGAVIVKGKVSGDISAVKRVELRAPAKVLGNISTPSLVIHEGVIFEGRCTMGSSADSKAEKTDKDSKVTLFHKEERANTSTIRMPSEAAK